MESLPIINPKIPQEKSPDFLTSPAELGGVSIQPGTHPKEGKSLSPSEVHPKTFPKEKAEQFKQTFPKFPKAADYVKNHSSGNEVVDRTMLQMAEVLDSTAESNFSKRVAHDIRHAEKQSDGPLSSEEKANIEEKVEKKFTDSLTFFITLDKRKGDETPLQRMAAPFAYLNPSEEGSFLTGTQEFAEHLARLAFEQQRDNPEQFVSHGFDHSINVANYTRDVLKMNPEIVSAMSKKYKISEGEAKFLLEQVALLHDTGYPCLGCRSKAVHGISGADLILPMREMFERIITSPGVDTDLLFTDFRNAILFHSADKIEKQFGAKIHTTMGVFLANPKDITKNLPKDIVTVLSNFYDPSKNPSNTPRFVVEIFVQNKDEKKAIKEALKESKEKFETIVQGPVKLPKVKIHEGLFDGRYADLEFNKDRLIGLEYSITDILENPLNMIRLVDNMDMRQTRMTLTQNESAFREIYKRLGDNKAISRLAIIMESFERDVDNIVRKSTVVERSGVNKAIARNTKALLNDIVRLNMKEGRLDSLEKSFKQNLTASKIEKISTPKEARKVLNETLIDTIFEQQDWQSIPDDIRADVRQIGMLQSSYDLRHFGGTEAIKNVELKSIPMLDKTGSIPCVVVTVERKIFEELNKIRVKEESLEIGVGEYQIWRASDAYRSIALGNASVQLRVLDENGQTVNCIINK